MVVLAFVLVFIGVFVFVFMQDIIVGANAGADGCNSRTCPAWLSEHSQGGVGVEGLQVVFVGRRHYTLVVFFRKGVRLCASAVFVSFEVLVVLRNQDLSVAAEVMSHWTRTNILYPLALHHMLFLPPNAYCGSFNVDSPCPHPSLEGRGDVVIVENVVLAALGRRKGICSIIQFKKTSNQNFYSPFFMFPRP